MLRNCEKMVLISSSPNQWSQNHAIDHDQKGLNLMGSGTMNEPAPAAGAGGQDHHEIKPQQEPLRCPRCDSSNTKFCYYNNYSLSQPRHFCKACKRYWTRGGTLRNVPVGGGCRKNKRLKRPTTHPAPSNDHQDHSTSSSSTPIFYGLPTNSSSDLNRPFSGYDHLQPQLNNLGLGFSSDHNLSGFNNGNISSSSLLSGYSSLFGNPSSSSSLTSLLASKFTNNGGFKDLRSASNLFESLGSPFDHEGGFHVMGSNGGGDVKEVKVEEGMKNRLEWGVEQNQTDQIVTGQSNDPNSVYNNWSSTWHDPANFGSSITSLI